MEKLPDDYYKVIFDNSLDGIMLTKPQGGIYRANRAVCEMLQMTEEEICTRGRFGILDTEDPQLKVALREREATGKSRTELTFIKKDGTRFPVDLTSVLVEDPQGVMWSVIIVRDISQLKQVEEQLLQAKEAAICLSCYDYLTGILNRRGFINRLEEEISRGAREDRPVSLILMDLDFFKNINDTHGHLYGDVALKKIAEAMGKSLRTYDILGRYGGDEFIICLPDTERSLAEKIAERLQREIKGMEIDHKGVVMKLTMSVGVAQYDWESKEDINAFITRADDDMYLTKNSRISR